MLAEKVLEEEGVVYAACYGEELEVIHRKITNAEELKASRGSKYVSSKLGSTFIEIRNELRMGKKVLFTGTPCQCEGLLSFLQEKTENLICVDFICHGVPGRTAWRAYLDSLKKRGINPYKINMRDKSTGWSKYHYSWHITDKKGKEIYQLQSANPYMKGFIRDLYIRPSCRMCQFKGTDRKTDITLGDYWGCWKIQPDMDDDKGTSLILVHTDKGMKYFDFIKNNIICENVIEENAVKYNPSIIRSSNRCSEGERNYFEKCIYEGKDFITVIEKMTGDSIMAKVRRKWIKLFFRQEDQHI